MASTRVSRREKNAERAQFSAQALAADNQQEKTTIQTLRVEECASAEQFRESALRMIREGDVMLDLEGVDHLDASALQILLAIGVEQKNRGRTLRLLNTSPGLMQWFEWTGAASHLVVPERR